MVPALGAEFPHEGFGVRGNYCSPAFRTYDFELDHDSRFLLNRLSKKLLKVFASEATSISTIKNLEIASPLALLAKMSKIGRTFYITARSERSLLP